MGACLSAIDLMAVGIAMPDHVTAWTGNNDDAPATTLSEIPTERFDCGTGESSPRIHQLVFQYVMQTDGFLAVDTNLPGSSRVNVAPYVLDSCTSVANQLSCFRDNGTAQGLAVSEHSLLAGTTVYIVLGGYDFSTTGTSSGDLEMRVHEVTPSPAGADCSDFRPFDACVDGAHCQIPDFTMFERSECLVDGTVFHARCRMSPPYCDAPFVCSADVPSYAIPGVCE